MLFYWWLTTDYSAATEAESSAFTRRPTAPLL